MSNYLKNHFLLFVIMMDIFIITLAFTKFVYAQDPTTPTVPTVPSVPSVLQEKMLQNLDFIHLTFKYNYAPAEWKKTYAGWDIDEEIKKAKDRVLAKPKLSIKEYQRILRDLFNGTMDYHVGFAFLSTEMASLPFQVMPIDGKFFISYIDRSKLPSSQFPASVGDEIVNFADRPVSEEISRLKKEITNGNDETNLALAALALTSRRGESAPSSIPQGPITIGVKKSGSEKIYNYQLTWSYRAERIDYSCLEKNLKFNSNPITAGYAPLFREIDQQNIDNEGKNILKRMTNKSSMLWMGNRNVENPMQIGATKSYIPDLGTKIWESDTTKNPFYAYIYKNEKNKFIGYVRIPHYMGWSGHVSAFKDIIAKFNTLTDGIVIDQINNPGGSIFYLYGLLSLLSDESMIVPKEREVINAFNVYDAQLTLDFLDKITDESSMQKMIGSDLGGYPINYQFVEGVRDYFRHMIAEYNKGKTLTDANPFFGIDRITANSDTRYTKPILLLINNLDFSGGDFFPAILQDNKRVTILGTRTAGAGGYINGLSYPNIFGLEYFTFTGSHAKRIDNNPIENLGVKPDIEYKITVDDLKSNFQGYAKKINESINNLL
ncbi:MAG: protease-like activity factor CPAF [Oligoflexia bacterium]|nr:protease-like activity factor CPAF [Oligoflexia bacterium]